MYLYFNGNSLVVAVIRKSDSDMVVVASGSVRRIELRRSRSIPLPLLSKGIPDALGVPDPQ